MQIGWATKDSVFKPEVPDSSRLIERLEKEGNSVLTVWRMQEGSGIGDDVFSYAYDGCRRQAWHAAMSAPVRRSSHRTPLASLWCADWAVCMRVAVWAQGEAMEGRRCGRLPLRHE